MAPIFRVWPITPCASASKRSWASCSVVLPCTPPHNANSLGIGLSPRLCPRPLGKRSRFPSLGRVLASLSAFDSSVFLSRVVGRALRRAVYAGFCLQYHCPNVTCEWRSAREFRRSKHLPVLPLSRNLQRKSTSNVSTVVSFNLNPDSPAVLPFSRQVYSNFFLATLSEYTNLLAVGSGTTRGHLL